MGNKVQSPGLHHKVIEETMAVLDAARIEKGLTEAEWARLSGLPQTSLARLSQEGNNLTMYSMCKLASGAGLRPRIVFEKLDPEDAYPPQPKRVHKPRAPGTRTVRKPSEPKPKKKVEYVDPKAEPEFKTIKETTKVASDHASGFTIKRQERRVASFSADDTAAAVEAFLAKKA